MAPQAPPRRLTRSRSDRMIGGVCGGIADYTGLDPVIFRVVFVVAAILGGAGLAAYLIALIVIPAEDEAESRVESWMRHRHGFGRILLIGAALLVVLAVGSAFDGPRHHVGGGFGVLVLLGFGLWLWMRHDDRPPLTNAPPAPPSPPPAPPVPPAPLASPDTTVTSVISDPTDVLPAWTPSAPRPKRERSRLFALTFSTMLLVAGVFAAVEASDAADISAGVVFASLLIVVGCGLLAGAWIGRSRGLIALGLVLTMCTAVATVADVPLTGGAGERTWRPIVASSLEREYRLGAGSLDLDLRELDVPVRVRHVDVSVGAGRVRLWLPEGADVELDTHVGMGSAYVLGLEDDGIDVDRHVDVEGGTSRRLVIDAHVGMGRLEVMR
jgi:phage shock protein PspC (stress-responsive transcriptional regulator)